MVADRRGEEGAKAQQPSQHKPPQRGTLTHYVSTARSEFAAQTENSRSHSSIASWQQPGAGAAAAAAGAARYELRT